MVLVQWNHLVWAEISTRTEKQLDPEALRTVNWYTAHTTSTKLRHQYVPAFATIKQKCVKFPQLLVKWTKMYKLGFNLEDRKSARCAMASSLPNGRGGPNKWQYPKTDCSSLMYYVG